MSKRFAALIGVVLALGPALAPAVPPNQVACYPFNEGAGGIARDSSGNAHHGRILGNPTWVPRPDGTDMALGFGPGLVEGVELPAFDPTDGTGRFTVALWAIWDGQETYHHFFTKSDGWGTETMMFQLELWGGSVSGDHFNRIGVSYDPDSVPFQTMPKHEWVHIAFVYDGAQMAVYMNGVDDIGPKAVDIGPAAEARTVIGVADNDARIWTGILDEVQIYSRPLNPNEVLEVMEGDRALAHSPNPANGALDIPLETILSWKAGEFAAGHDVYFGTVFENIDAATRQDPRNVLWAQGQAATRFDPDTLAHETTYYWRIDEVNEAPDRTIHRGTVWRFTTEPVGKPIDGVTAAASHHEPGAGPEKTIDGSGLNVDNEHSTDPADMWLATPGPGETLWIEYEFDKVRKLHEMRVWNHNGEDEPTLGLGAKDVIVEYSIDGQSWTPLGETAFAQATGLPIYTANTSVGFGDVPARHVRLTLLSGWGQTGRIGLSEVRFLAIPVEPKGPQPADGAVDVDVTTTLGWAPGRGVVAHEVHLDQDVQAVADGSALVGVVDANRYDPIDLNLGARYYWKIAEVTNEDPLSWAGDIWSFTTQTYATIEDFERYTDDIEAGETIWQTWIDGIDDPNNGGAVVGYTISPFAEQTIVNGGNQSMPLTYDNRNANRSQAYRIWDVAQDWTYGQADTLTLHFRGHPVDFLRRPDGSIVMGAAGADLWGTADEFRFAYRQLSGDGQIVARVDSLAPTNDWSKAGVMIRESLNPGSRHALVAMTPGNGVAFQYRQTTNAVTANVNQAGLTTPYWVRLTRTGNSLTATRSADGQNWVPITGDAAGSTVDIGMINNVYIGLALASTSAGEPTTAEFSEVVSNGTGAWANEAIGVEMPSNDPESMYVIVEDSSGRSHTVAHEDPAASNIPAWKPWSIPLSELAEADVDVTAVRKMTIGLGNPGGGGEGIIYVDDIRISRSMPHGN